MKHITGILTALLICSSICYAGEKPAFKLPKSIRKAYTFIPPGHFYDLKHDSISVHGFWMRTTEISNLEYKEFLFDLKKQGRTEDFKVAQIDSSSWEKPLQYGEPMKIHYHRHPAYNNYPVVNISHEAAEMYCEWLAKKLNEVYGDEYKFEAYLPSHDQWRYAAHGGYHLTHYPWGGPYLRNFKGCYLCNFNNLSSENIHYNDTTEEYELLSSGGGIFMPSDNSALTSPTESYEPNRYGLYNMSGNVAEMIQEQDIACGGSFLSSGYDVRIESIKKYTKAQPDIGFRPCLKITKK